MANNQDGAAVLHVLAPKNGSFGEMVGEDFSSAQEFVPKLGGTAVRRFCVPPNELTFGPVIVMLGLASHEVLPQPRPKFHFVLHSKSFTEMGKVDEQTALLTACRPAN